MQAGVPTIVVVDDAAEVRLLVKTRLRLSGSVAVVGEGADGTEAVALASKHHPSLLLLDVSMPVMDGFEALPRVLEASPDTRVVLYSGFEEEGLAQRARELGAAAFIEKSSSIDALVEDLLTILEPLTGALGVGTATPSRDTRQVSTAGDQQVLDEHLERFREVFEEAAIGMATMTLNGRLVRVNRAFTRLLRRPSEGLIGAAYADLTEGRDAAVAIALEDIHRRGKDVVQVEHQVPGPPDGRELVATLSPVRDSSGRPLYIFLQVQDVTATRAAEAELRKSENRFRLLVEAVEDYAIFMLSPEGNIVSWNAGAQRIKGYTADEIIGQHFRVFYPPELQQARHPEHELELALRDGHYEEAGWRIRKDGTRFWANVLITAVYDAEGAHVGFAKVTRDITARRDAEQQLRESEERFRRLLESVHDYAIYMLDTEGRIASWNVGAEQSKGYTADEIIGQHFRVFYPPERQAEQHPEHELEIAKREGHYEEEGWRVRKDGSRFWANVVITTVFDSDGNHVGFAKVTRDITERRRMAEERELAAEALAAANDELEAVNDRLRQVADDQSQFLAVTAHELRTPVGVLGGSAEMLDKHWQELTEEERGDILRGMTASAGRLRRLLGDLLTASRLERRVLQLHPSAVNVASVVQDAVATVRRAHPDVEVSVVGTPDVDVLADPDRLAQSLDNLIGNALRHGASPVQVSVQSQPATVEIRVSDLGPGVAAEMQPRLFERFATGDSKGGTGLGLFIVRELARAQGGDASYEPRTQDQPAGAFVISLPRPTDRSSPAGRP
jgi:PAS domain S-box-containing protein